MSRKVTTIFLFFLLLIVPVHVAAASSPEEDLEEHFDELEESIDEITTIEMSVEQSNNSILNAIKERIFQAIFERSQIAQNISQSKVELNRTKETSIAIKGEINRIRSSETIQISENELAKLIKQSATTVRTIKNSQYKIGQSGYETIGLIREIRERNIDGVRYQINAIINNSNERVATLQTLNENLEAILYELQQIQ